MIYEYRTLQDAKERTSLGDAIAHIERAKALTTNKNALIEIKYLEGICYLRLGLTKDNHGEKENALANFRLAAMLFAAIPRGTAIYAQTQKDLRFVERKISELSPAPKPAERPMPKPAPTPMPAPAPAPAPVPSPVNVAAKQAEDRFAEREAALAEREAGLTARERGVEAREAELTQTTKAHADSAAAIQAQLTSLGEQVGALQRREAELVEQARKLTETNERLRGQIVSLTAKPKTFDDIWSEYSGLSVEALSAIDPILVELFTPPPPPLKGKKTSNEEILARRRRAVEFVLARLQRGETVNSNTFIKEDYEIFKLVMSSKRIFPETWRSPITWAQAILKLIS